MIDALKVRLSLGSTNAPSLPNGSTKPDVGELNHATVGVDGGQRSPSRTRKRAIDQAPYQESVAARELRIFYNRNKLCNSFKKVLSSSAGLLIVLLLYICLGAVLFQQFERVEEDKARDTLNQERLTFVTKKIESCNNDTECIVFEIKEWEKLILENYPVFYIINNDTVWTFDNAFYFCFTTISTIGYGTIAPRTGIGRISCIFYAIVGIPLMLLFIADVGTALARWAKICAIAIKQNRKRTTAFKEAAKASLRRHLRPQKNNSSPEVEDNEEVDAIAAKQQEDDTACEAPSLHVVDETEEGVGRDEFWVKMHLPKRSLSMTTQDSQSFDNDDGHSSEDESDASDGSSHCSTGTESKEGSLDTLKIGDSHVGGSEMDPEGTEDVFHVENDTSVLATEEDRIISNEMQDLLGDLTHKCSTEGLNSSCKGTANIQFERSNMKSDCNDATQTRKPSPMMRRQSSRVGFGEVIDLQSGKRTSIQSRRSLPSANSGDDERSSLGGEIIENPLVETDEEGEADKLLKPKGFSSSPRRNAVFIPGSDTSPSSPPTSPDMGGRKSQSSAPSRRRSSITRRMGMAFGSISAVSDREVAHFSFPAWLALLLLIIYLLFGAGIVSHIDKWSFVDSFYFSFISLSTIGFGDLTPKKSWIFSFLYTFLGMCFTSMCMSLSSKELTRLLKKLAWKAGYYKSRQWKGSVRAFVKDKRRRIHERSEHWRGSRKQKNRKRKRPSGHRVGEKVSVRTQNPSSGIEQGQDHSGQGTT